MNWLIYCLSRQMWWKPGCYGYTDDLAEAGLFSKEQADSIARDANVVTENEVALPEHLVKQQSSEPPLLVSELIELQTLQQGEIAARFVC
ncbi:hypothetical protein IC617_08935 [Neiella sp. HB171785]|uniref:Uncharacterized protein n=1 Tax=Neiella litorisoli TaxID=2771431 RepID=A0A8J6UPV2_9GAMM|nr:hypothetical protein [Neiella litorisoli]MBD1389552.1 hypothetical protein [Neiella litorisoli]